MAFFGGDVARQGGGLTGEAELRHELADPASDAEEFAILPENWEALGVFLAARTQWRRAGMSGAMTGLDYAGVRQVAEARGVAWTGALLGQLQDFEAGALEAFDERARRERPDD